MGQTKLNDRKKKMIILVATLILFVGASFAFIAAQLSGGIIGNANVTADTTDILQFEVDKDINLNPNQFNVTEGGDNLSDTAVGSAILRANSTDENATYNYYVYFQINSNDYVYTTEEHIPEIILTITDSEDNPVTNINGLEYVNGEVSGFDITTKKGLYTVAELYEITSISSISDTIQDWTFTVSFINLDTNQYENGGKTLEAEVILSREPIYTLASYITNELYTGVDGDNGLYYHDGVGTYINADQETGNYSYRFSGGDYEIAETYQGTYNQIYDEMIIYYCDGMEISLQDGEFCLGDYYYTLSYNTNNVQYASLNEALEQAISDGYLTKDNIKNYVCFGSGETPCPEENLYRIIGVFDGQVKLIKADYVTSVELGTDGRDYCSNCINVDANYYKGTIDASAIARYSWNYDTSVSRYGSSNWTTSELNTINLNTNYWNYLGTNWQNLIATTTWHLGGMDVGGIIAKEAYNAERSNNGYGNNPTTYTDEIGLMYPSDYGFAASPIEWSLSSSTVTQDNWLYMGVSEWTITPGLSNYQAVSLILPADGSVYLGSGTANGSYAIRPVFYLNSNVELSGGSGTESAPYTLVV